MAVKKAAKAKEDAKETIANEAIRRKAGKVRLVLPRPSAVPGPAVRLRRHALAAGHEHHPGRDAAEGAA